MSGARVERRLAAILAVDVAGYSRLMGEDEEGTLAALRAVRRELADPKIVEHRGRIVKTTGGRLQLRQFACGLPRWFAQGRPAGGLNMLQRRGGGILEPHRAEPRKER
jgi:class 3 adenylate cyclase